MSEVHVIKFFKKDGELFAALFAEPSTIFPEFWIKNVQAEKLGFSALPKNIRLQRKYKVKELGLKPFESNKEGLAFGVSDFLYRLTKGSSKENHTYITNSIMNNYEQSGNFGIGQMGGGNIADGAKVVGVINEAKQQNLVQAAETIQSLLEQLKQTYTINATTGKMVIATRTIELIESDPTLTELILRALKAGSISALEQLVNHPAASFVFGALDDWQQTKILSDQ
ncbi:MAG: hypothetical protein AAFQ14_17865 [Cyanobacteria bacterium J06621_12]